MNNLSRPTMSTSNVHESSKLEENSMLIKDESLSLVLSLRIHDQFSLQDRPQSIRIPTFSLPSLTKKSSNTLSESSYLLSNNHPIIDPSLSIITTEQQQEINHNVPLPTINMEDSIPISAKQQERMERKNHRYKLQREIITLAKKALKPSYQKHYITKEDYKTIMKKVVTKAIYSNRIDQKWIDKSIHSYVKKYRTR